MKLIKKTATHRIFQRKDGRHAVRDLQRKPVNGEEKVAILVAEGLISLTQPREPEPVEEEQTEDAAETQAEEGQAEDQE